MSIEIKNLTKNFGDKEVLKGIDFVFEKRAVNMIIGASGSGKSVMTKCIVGLLQPDSGEISFDGESILEKNYNEMRVLRQEIGMLFQNSALFDSYNVEDNVAFPIKMFTNWTKAEIKKRVEFCLERVNLQNSEHLYPGELSGGMKKRVGIARAIALNPKYLFVDEPNSGLDPLTASVIDKLIQEITYDFNTTTIVVSHDMNSVLNISDKIMFLYQGHKEWEGSRQDILDSGNAQVDRFVYVSDYLKMQKKQQGGGQSGS